MFLILKLKHQLEMAQSSDEESGNDLTDNSRQRASKRPRRTGAQDYAKRKAELATLQALDTTYYSGAKRKKVENEIHTLEQQIKKYEMKSAMQPATSASSDKRATGKQKETFTDEETERLIYARTALDHEYNQHVQSSAGKWQMVQNFYNNGFTCVKSLISPQPEDDVRFEALNADKHKSAAALTRKWDKS